MNAPSTRRDATRRAASRLIREIFAQADRPVLSFEFFPPKTPKGEDELIATARGSRS